MHAALQGLVITQDGGLVLDVVPIPSAFIAERLECERGLWSSGSAVLRTLCSSLCSQHGGWA